MNETFTYEWSEKLGMSACMALQAAKGTRLLFLAVSGIILMILGWWSYASMKHPILMFAGFAGLFFLVVPIRVYFVYRRLVKDARRLFDDPQVSVLIDDVGLTISSGKNTHIVEWAKTPK